MFETLTVREEGAVLFAQIAAPPMNLLGPEAQSRLQAAIKRGFQTRGGERDLGRVLDDLVDA